MEMRQSYYYPHHPVPAHAEIADIVKKNNTGFAGGIARLAKQRADDSVRAARFVYDGRPKAIVVRAEPLDKLSKRAISKIGSARDDHASGFATGVRIDHPNALYRIRQGHFAG